MGADLEIGRWYIDTKKRISVTLISIIYGSEDVCVVKTDDEEIYLVTTERLIPYNKYYWD